MYMGLKGSMAFGPAVPRPGATPLEHAAAHLGVIETTGPNRGPLIDRWLRRMGLDPEHGPPQGYPWCAAFVCCMVLDAGWRVKPSAGVRRLWEKNADLITDTTQEGDLVLRLVSGHTHVEIFSHVTDGGRWITIGGNTNAAGSREGNAVEWKDRDPGFFQGVLRPRKA